VQPDQTLDAMRWRSIVDTARDGIITIDARGRITSFNRAAEAIFGYRADEVEGQNISMLMPEPYQSAHDGYLDAYQRTGEKRIMGTIRPVRARRKDGRTTPVELSVSEGWVGDERFFTGVVRDVLSTERRYHQVVELADAIIIVLSDSLDIVEFNRQAEQTFGAAREVICEQPFLALFPAEKREALNATLQAILSGGEAASFDSFTADETRFVSWRISRLAEGGGAGGLIAVGHDLTERRAAEQALRSERAKVMHADKLSSIGQLAAGVAHEVNNPLAGIKSLCAALRSGRVSEARADTYHAAIEDGLTRIEQTVRALLDYARPTHGPTTALDLHAIATACLRLTRATFNKKSVDADLQFEPGDWMVIGDRHGLLQALMNVLLNALHASPSGGTVTLRAEAIKEQIALHVEDDGPGIAAEHISRICDPFFSTKPEGEGTGLGLSVTQSILSRNGGELLVGNTADRGACISFVLPGAS
jgi:two-component system sensor kinase FixL